MLISYIAPFRVNFDLNKDALLARWDVWAETVQQAEQKIDRAPPNSRLGNYAWGMVHRLQQGEELAYGGTETDDPSWFFRRFFTIAFEGTCHYSPSSDGTTSHPDLFGNQQTWECRLIDNTVGLLILTAECPFEPFLNHLRNGGEEDLKAFLEQCGQRWSKQTLVDIRGEVDHASQWVRDHLAGPMGPEVSNLEREFYSSFETPVYPLPKANSEALRPMWTHEILAFSHEERIQLRTEEETFLRLFPSEENAKAWLDGGPNSYDWGTTVVTVDARYGNQWQDGNCISQFYFLCFDLADTALPVAIANQRIQTANKKFASVLESAQDIRQSMNLIATDYSDLMTRCASEGYRSLEMYHRTWRMKNLLEGLDKKTALLEELISAASEGVARRNQERIQYILAFITILSVVGGMASMHDYLAEGYDPSAPELIPQMALSISKVTVFATSLTIAILAFAAYFLFNRHRF